MADHGSQLCGCVSIPEEYTRDVGIRMVDKLATALKMLIRHLNSLPEAISKSTIKIDKPLSASLLDTSRDALWNKLAARVGCKRENLRVHVRCRVEAGRSRGQHL